MHWNRNGRSHGMKIHETGMLIGVTVLAPGVSLLAIPTSLEAQQRAAGISRVGWLEVCGPGPRRPNFDIFRDRLAELGYVEGKNLIIEQRFADCRYDRMPGLATELAQTPVDVLFTMGTRASRIVAENVKTTPLCRLLVRPIRARHTPRWARGAQRKSDRCYMHDNGAQPEAPRTAPRSGSQGLAGDVSS